MTTPTPTTGAASELLPCPLCHTTDYFETTNSLGMTVWVHTAMGSCMLRCFVIDDIARWNTRTPAPVTEGAQREAVAWQCRPRGLVNGHPWHWRECDERDYRYQDYGGSSPGEWEYRELFDLGEATSPPPPSTPEGGEPPPVPFNPMEPVGYVEAIDEDGDRCIEFRVAKTDVNFSITMAQDGAHVMATQEDKLIYSAVLPAPPPPDRVQTRNPESSIAQPERVEGELGDCSNCGGTGQVAARPSDDCSEVACPYCRGSGWTTRQPQLADYKAWYIDAMVASNEAGFVGLTAAETIRELAAAATRAQAASAGERVACGLDWHTTKPRWRCATCGWTGEADARPSCQRAAPTDVAAYREVTLEDAAKVRKAFFKARTWPADNLAMDSAMLEQLQHIGAVVPNL